MSVTYDFKEGAVVIFGGSGGAGGHITRAFAKAGCTVAFTYFGGKGRADDLEKELRDAGCTVAAYQADIKQPERPQEIIDEVAHKYGPVHTVVYAAGPVIEVCPIVENGPERFKLQVDSELLGFFHIVRGAIGHLRENRGTLIACTSFANYKVLINDGLSASAKAGIESLVRQIAVEEGRYGVRANSIGLGWFDIGQGAIAPIDQSTTQSDIGKDMVKLMSSMIPLGNRPGRGEELANTVLFFASEQASYITGQTLLVDGGISL